MTARTVARLFDQQMKKVGLTGTQFTLLVAIATRQFSSISELGQTLCIEKSTLSRNLRPLIEDGLIERDTSSLGRAIVHRLTPEGEERLEAACPLWSEAQDQIEARMGVDQMRDGYRFMAKLRTAAIA